MIQVKNRNCNQEGSEKKMESDSRFYIYIYKYYFNFFLLPEELVEAGKLKPS